MATYLPSLMPSSNAFSAAAYPSPPTTPPDHPQSFADVKMVTNSNCDHTILSNLELHLRYKDVGMRKEEDKRCFNCLAKCSYAHRLNWTNCTETCPACPLDRQHHGQFCSRLCRLRKQERFWKERADLSYESARTSSLPRGRSKLRERKVKPPLSSLRLNSPQLSSREISRRRQSPSRCPSPDPASKRYPDPTPRKPEGRNSARDQKSNRRSRSRSRSPPTDHSRRPYRTRDEQRPCEGDRSHPAEALGPPLESNFLENFTVRENILKEARHIASAIERHPCLDKILLGILNFTDFLGRHPRRYMYTPSKATIDYLEYIHTHFPRLLSREAFNNPRSECNRAETSHRRKDSTRNSGRLTARHAIAVPSQRSLLSYADLHDIEQDADPKVAGPENGEIKRCSMGASPPFARTLDIASQHDDGINITEEGWEDLFKGDV